MQLIDALTCVGHHITGVYGSGFAEMATQIGADVRVVEFAYDQPLHDFGRIAEGALLPPCCHTAHDTRCTTHNTRHDTQHTARHTHTRHTHDTH